MNMTEQKKNTYTVVELTTTELFFIPDDHKTEAVMNEWFGEESDIDRYHAYRDGSKIGNSKKVVSYKQTGKTIEF